MNPASPVRTLTDIFIYTRYGTLDATLAQITLARRDLMRDILQASERGLHPCELKVEWVIFDEPDTPEGVW